MSSRGESNVVDLNIVYCYRSEGFDRTGFCGVN